MAQKGRGPGVGPRDRSSESTAAPAQDTVLVDLNFAYHPSSVWNSMWQCPLAPLSNRLSVAVCAGERTPGE